MSDKLTEMTKLRGDLEDMIEHRNHCFEAMQDVVIVLLNATLLDDPQTHDFVSAINCAVSRLAEARDMVFFGEREDNV